MIIILHEGIKNEFKDHFESLGKIQKSAKLFQFQ